MRKLALMSALLVLGCHVSSEWNDREKVNEQQKVYAQTQPIPFFKWSQDRDNLIQIYRMKNESRPTYTVVRAEGTGEILWHCPSVGFPLPADTQLTNPLQSLGHEHGIVEQAEPNGLFTSKHTDATYVICVLPDGSLTPQSTEMKAEVFTRPIKVEEVNGKLRVVFLDGKASMIIKPFAPMR